MNDLFKELGLTSLAKRLPQVLEQARQGQPSYETFLQQALQAEVDGRKQRAQERRRRAAHLPTTKSLEAFDFSFQPTLSPALVQDLAGLAFVQTATNIILLGPPGVGKTHLGIALLVKALEAGHSALFTTLAHLVEALEAAPTQPWRHRLRRFLKPQVLLIDEVGYTRLTAEQAHQLFELVNARYEQGAIILTSNTSFAEWGSLLGDEVLATALLDRLLHHAEVLTINGRSYRMKERLPTINQANQAQGVLA